MKTFKEMDLPDSLQAALEKIEFINTTPIQEKALPILIDGKDLIACSETGSGKTAAYLIPMVKHLINNPEACGLVMAPTRELAQQIAEFLTELTAFDKKFHTVRLVGGADIRKQFRALQKRPRVIVATPGRLIDHLKRNTVQVHKTEILVLDEGDRMIDMGFAPQLKEILKHLPEKRQTSFFTATVDKKVIALANQYLVKPQKIMIGESRPVASIKQSVVQVEFKDKDECVLHECNSREGSIIVFVKTKHRTDLLHRYLSDYGLPVDIIHGGRTQGERNRAISGFKKGKSRILCATDVAARGIDVPHVEHVINFDLPMMEEDYVHRIGRTARNGAEGEAVTFVTPNEHRDWNRLVKKYNIQDALLEENGRSSDRGGRKRSSSRNKSASDGKRPYGKKKAYGSRSSSRDEDSDPGRKAYGGKKKAFSKKSTSKYADSDADSGRKAYGEKKNSYSKKSSSRDDSFSGKTPYGKKSAGKKSYSEDSAQGKKTYGKKASSGGERPSANQRAQSVKLGDERPTFKKKKSKGNTFKKAGGFKKSRSKQSSSRA